MKQEEFNSIRDMQMFVVRLLMKEPWRCGETVTQPVMYSHQERHYTMGDEKLGKTKYVLHYED